MNLRINYVLTLVLIIFTTTFWAQKSFEEFVLIGNSTGQKEIKATNVAKIFKGMQNSWKNGNSVILVFPTTNSTESDKIAKIILNANSTAMQKYWLGLVFQGRAIPPYFFDTTEEIIEFVLKTPGSIALLPSNYETKLDRDIIITIK